MTAGHTKDRTTIFFIGMALSIAQFIMIRDFVTILYGEEVVIVLVTATFFLGLSIGYLLSLRLSQALFRRLFLLAVVLHLSFPFSYRYLAAWLSDMQVGGSGFLLFLFSYALIFNTMFATFLPRLVTPADGPDGIRLRDFYALELLGFMTGFIIIGISWNRPAGFLLAVYWSILTLLVYLVIRHRAIVMAYAASALLAVVFVNQLDRHSTQAVYAHKHGIAGARVLYSMNSPYQKVEVIENDQGGRHLFLDGLENLNSSDLAVLNYYIAELPASLIRPSRTLLIGNGTLSSVNKVYPYSGQVDSVELDGGVLQAGERFFTSPETLSGLEHWQLYVDDGKHFLRTSEADYDLVIVDVPSPLTIQEAYLHTVEFYQLVKRRLSENGVISIQLSGKLANNTRTPARIAAALRKVFDEVLVVYSQKAQRGFAYASHDLPFDSRTLKRAAAVYETGIRVVPPLEVSRSLHLSGAEPLSLDSMDVVLRRGLERFAERYFND